MNASEAVFRGLLAVSVTLAVLVLALFPFQEPGTGSYVVSILALAVQGCLILIASAGLYFEWRPFAVLDDE